MALTPINFIVNNEQQAATSVQTDEMPSKTWSIDLEKGRLGRVVDGETAIRQYIRKAFMTARNRFLIYDDFYGEELTDLIGQNLTPNLMQVEIPRVVREAIIYDDRIASVPNVIVNMFGKDGIHIDVEVELTNGQIISEEVTLWR